MDENNKGLARPDGPGSCPADPAGLGAARVDPSRYAVAVTMTKDIPTGANIVTRLNIWSALSIDEAVGLAVQDAQDMNPKHQILTIAKMVIPENVRDSDEHRNGEDAQRLSGEAMPARAEGIAEIPKHREWRPPNTFIGVEGKIQPPLEWDSPNAG